MNSNTKKEVSLASHTQYVPHVGLPHKEPVTRVIKVKLIPIIGISLEKT